VEARDVEAVRDLVTRTGVFSAAEVAIAAELVEETLRNGPAAGYEFVLADHAGGLAGYSCFGPVPATAASHDLYWIAVDPARHGHGLGAELLARSEARITELGGRRVWVDTSSRADYAAAHRLYRKAGYRLAARLDAFYAPGDSKLIFAKSLADPDFEESRGGG
jgi:ribosomal protein S18 acetylase RimI-like enzyme